MANVDQIDSYAFSGIGESVGNIERRRRKMEPRLGIHPSADIANEACFRFSYLHTAIAVVTQLYRNINR